MPAAKAAPIGVFDSGLGGLSVLKALQAELPHAHFIYVADSGHAPYGERDDAHVIARARAIARHLQTQHGIQMLVVACNTATAAAIHLLRAEFAALRIVGIEPALKPAATLSRTGTVGVLATRGTLQSDKFSQLLQALSGQAHYLLQPCDGLADAIEREDATKIEALCAMYTGALGTFGNKSGQIDTLVLGCTHYPFIVDVLRQHTGNAVHYLEAGAPVARQAHRLLAEHPAALLPPGSSTFFTTGKPAPLRNALLHWLHQDAPVHCVDIP